MAHFKGAFQSTVLGSFIRLVSRNRILKYAEEIQIPDRYRVDQKRSDGEFGPSSHRASDTTFCDDTEALAANWELEKGPDLNLVTWYGTNDPENP